MFFFSKSFLRPIRFRVDVLIVRIHINFVSTDHELSLGTRVVRLASFERMDVKDLVGRSFYVGRPLLSL